MKREPVAMPQTRQVRVVVNVLTKKVFNFRRLIVRACESKNSQVRAKFVYQR